MAAAPQGVESTTTTTSVTPTEAEVHEKKVKPPKRDCRTMWSARVAFLRTKRAIAGITIFVVIAILLISLGGTHVLDGTYRGKIPEEGESKTCKLYHDLHTYLLLHQCPVAMLLPSSVPVPAGVVVANVPAIYHAANCPKKQLGRSALVSCLPQSNARRQFPGSIKNGTALRIMALGASTVKGQNSPGDNGFRKQLRDELTELGVPVNMVGSVKAGEMLDNECEAQGGARVSEVFKRAKRVVPEMQPNVFLINAGVNNALQLFELETAGRDMEDMVNYLLDTSPRSFVVISTLLTNTLKDCEQYMLQVNQQLWDVFAKLEREGKWVLMADMHYSGKDPDAILPEDITPDGTHPTAEAYSKMGHIFVKAIQRADKLGYIQVPAPNGIPDDGEAEALAAQNAPAQPLAKRIAAASDNVVQYLTAEEGRKRFMLQRRAWCGVPDE
ncbi:carbohydrate esterase family 3 protein [Apiospora hydei]|uniref:Carbohydrate esterase family 3 protein n=1 Tax=Apiospora hydei TaxID=1337664 RepID=A0ABR1VX12_9PEZI